MFPRLTSPTLTSTNKSSILVSGSRFVETNADTQKIFELSVKETPLSCEPELAAGTDIDTADCLYFLANGCHKSDINQQMLNGNDLLVDRYVTQWRGKVSYKVKPGLNVRENVTATVTVKPAIFTAFVYVYSVNLTLPDAQATLYLVNPPTLTLPDAQATVYVI